MYCAYLWKDFIILIINPVNSSDYKYPVCCQLKRFSRRIRSFLFCFSLITVTLKIFNFDQYVALQCYGKLEVVGVSVNDIVISKNFTILRINHATSHWTGSRFVIEQSARSSCRKIVKIDKNYFVCMNRKSCSVLSKNQSTNLLLDNISQPLCVNYLDRVAACSIYCWSFSRTINYGGC